MSFDLIAEAYRERASLFNKINAASPWHQLHRRLTERRLRELVPGGKVIDLAAGTGITGISLAARGCQVTMVDALPQMCELAREAIPAELKNATEVINADAASFRECEPASFDAAICTQALNFFEEPAKVFATASFALKPGGLLYFDIDSAYRWTVIEALAGHIDNALHIAEQGSDRDLNIVGANYYFSSIDKLEHKLAAAGFTDIAVSGLLYVVPFLHLFHPSIEFLTPERLHPSVLPLTHPDVLDRLEEMEDRLTGIFSRDAAGFHVFSARKAGA